MKHSQRWADELPNIMEADSREAAVLFIEEIQKDALRHARMLALELNDHHEWPVTRILDNAINHLPPETPFYGDGY